MNTRGLEEEDIPRVARWNVELHEDEGSVVMSVDAAAERLRRWIAKGVFRGVIFIADGIPIGYALYEHRPAEADPRSGETVYLRQFFIARESRRQGRGTAAFRLLVRERVPGSARVVLDVKVSNPSGQRFWESLGFEATCVAYELPQATPDGNWSRESGMGRIPPGRLIGSRLGDVALRILGE